MLTRLWRYRRRGLSRRHPRWAALDARLGRDAADVTMVRPVSEIQANEISAWWTHPVPGSERLVQPVDRTEVRPLPVDTHHHHNQ